MSTPEPLEQAQTPEDEFEMDLISTLKGTVYDGLEVELIRQDPELQKAYKGLIKKTIAFRAYQIDQTQKAMKEQDEAVRLKQKASGIQHAEANAQTFATASDVF